MSSDVSPPANSLPLAVVGGGITGLAAALKLEECFPGRPIHLLESALRLGGVLQTTRKDGYLIEHAADNFLADRSSLDFFRQYHLDDQLIPTNARYRRALVVRHGRLHRIPEGFRLLLPGSWAALLRSPLLSLRGRLRVLTEPLVRRHRSSSEESLEQFAIRRLGREAFEWLVQPLVAGIYTGDPQQLSLDAALPQFRRWELQYGSLTRAGWHLRKGSWTTRSDSGARYSQFLGPAQGMAELVDQLAARFRFAQVRLDSRVERIEPLEGTWRLQIADRRQGELYGGVVIALPVLAAAALLQTFDKKAAQVLRQIPCASSAVAALAFPSQCVKSPLDAFGIVVPAAEQRPVLAVSMASLKFPGRAPAGYQLFRVFLGGALRPELLELTDDRLLSLAVDQTRQLLRIQGQPAYQQLVRWPETMPQYNLGHFGRLQKLREAVDRWSGLALAGNYLTGVGIPQCICSGQQAAEKLLRVES